MSVVLYREKSRSVTLVCTVAVLVASKKQQSTHKSMDIHRKKNDPRRGHPQKKGIHAISTSWSKIHRKNPQIGLKIKNPHLVTDGC